MSSAGARAPDQREQPAVEDRDRDRERDGDRERNRERNGERDGAAARARPPHRAFSNVTWNSIQHGVIAVFQRKGLPEHGLYNLNEGVRQLLKTELGSFFTEYLQNQLLTKGMVILRDKVHFYEGQKLLDSLAETWEFFFGHALPTLQAIFYPVQGKEPPLRQRALLHFRDIIALNVRLDDALARPRARVPPAVIQMLLVLQGVHESQGVTEEYLKLEALVQKVVSPYLGTYGLYSRDGPFTHSCLLENRFSRRPKPGEALAKSAVSRSKSYNHPLLMPVVEFEAEGPVPNCGPAGRKRSLSEMASCPELQALPRPPPAPPGPDPGGHGRDPDPDPPRDPAPGPAPSSSPELAVDRILESLDSDAEGIFIDFSRGRSGPAGVCLDGGRQSVV